MRFPVIVLATAALVAIVAVAGGYRTPELGEGFTPVEDGVLAVIEFSGPLLRNHLVHSVAHPLLDTLGVEHVLYINKGSRYPTCILEPPPPNSYLRGNGHFISVTRPLMCKEDPNLCRALQFAGRAEILCDILEERDAKGGPWPITFGVERDSKTVILEVLPSVPGARLITTKEVEEESSEQCLCCELPSGTRYRVQRVFRLWSPVSPTKRAEEDIKQREPEFILELSDEPTIEA